MVNSGASTRLEQAQPQMLSWARAKTAKESMKATTTLCSILQTRKIFGLASALLILLLISPAAAQINVPLTIQETSYPGIAGVARTLEPVTVGIPLAKGAVACGNANPASCAGLSSLGLAGASIGQFR